jgi:hypothetical protein
LTVYITLIKALADGGTFLFTHQTSNICLSTAYGYSAAAVNNGAEDLLMCKDAPCVATAYVHCSGAVAVADGGVILLCAH